MSDVRELIDSLSADERAYLKFNLDILDDPEIERFDLDHDVSKVVSFVQGTEYASAHRHGPRRVAIGKGLLEKGVFDFFEVEDGSASGQVVFAFTRLGAEVMVSLAGDTLTA